MLPILNNTFTTESGYTYKYFTDEDIELIKSDEHIVDVLNAATTYPFIHSVTVSKKLYGHLKYFLEITPVGNAHNEHEHSYIYKHQEGFIDIVPNNNRDAVTLVIWVEPGREGGDQTINNELYEEILSKGSNIDRVGLQCLLDPNVGGSISPMRLSVANLIIFG